MYHKPCCHEDSCSIGAGLQAAVLSPDTETIVFLSGDNTLILMTGDFDPIAEKDLFSSDEGEKEMINVQWGKKETQFTGAGGKKAAKWEVTQDESNNISDLEECVRQPNISWRGDSTLFAVNYWCPKEKCQKINIYSKVGRLQCRSQQLTGLNSTLSWRPSGNLIASSQDTLQSPLVCFIEKNGLSHGCIRLQHSLKVQDISWNSESSILSTVCMDKSTDQPCILIWTCGNYHWYLKQRLNFNSVVVALCWDNVISNLAHVLLEDGTYLVYQWAWTVNHSVGIADDDLAVVAVIDGGDVKLSVFKKCIIPPPMCGAKVTLPSPALQIMFSSFSGEHSNSCNEQSPNDLCVFMSDGQLGIIKGVESAPKLHCVLPVQWTSSEVVSSTRSSLSHWLWLSKDQMLCVFHSGASYVCVVQIGAETAKIVSEIPVDEVVLTVSHKTGSPGALIQLCSGKVLEFHDGCLTPTTTLPEPCVSVQRLGQSTISRTYNNHLYVDGELIASNVTSYFCVPQFLVMTLSSHQLLVTNAKTAFKVHGENEVKLNRRLERGATVVIVTGHSVILQLPRGNLETVQPRALTLVTAARLLDAGDYKQVAQLLRRQRMDLNLCVDHNPYTFLLSVTKFVAQVRDPQWLSVFVAELSERDVTRTTYAGYYKNHTPQSPSLVYKVEKVCTALREAMTQTPEDHQHFLQPILSTYVRTDRISDAIALANTDEALSYLTLLISTDELYEEALGAYNLGKALKIAEKSLMDPKEYLAYLNELRQMEPSYMRFTLDKRLHKPESALRNLAQCTNKSAECLQFVTDTGLYALALNLFREQPDIYKELCLLYAAHLQERQSYEEAGLMYRRGGDIDKALYVLNKAGCWRQCLVLAKQHNYSESAMKELQELLYSSLSGRQEFNEAADMCEHLGWTEKAISCHAAAHNWVHAVYACCNHESPHLIESVVKPALLDWQSCTLADLKTKRDKLDKHCSRLVIVLEQKARTDANFDAMSDIQSDTSSLSSFSTSSAGSRTTRNTRKAQRKLWSLKEGNPREEKALLYTISELIQNTERLTGDVHSTCMALAEFGLDTESSTLHSAMAAGLDHIQELRHSIWPAFVVKKFGSDADTVDPTPIDVQLNFPPASCVSSSWKLNIYS